MVKSYPNRIKELRNRIGLTQHELGGKFKKTKDITVISRWERGKVKPSSENLLELAEILKETPDKIFLFSIKPDKSVYNF